MEQTTVTPLTLADAIEYSGSVILKYKIVYPHFTSQKFSRAAGIINEYYKSKTDDFLVYIHDTLVQNAIDDYKNSVANGYPVHQYEADSVYTLTYNRLQLVSLYTDRYEYTGGAHGSTIRSSETWDMESGSIVPLEAFYPGNPNYIEDIENEIIMQITEDIKAGRNYYFDDYAQRVKQTFNPKSFYMIPGSLVFYFQQYDIAPYSSGIPEFQIAFA